MLKNEYSPRKITAFFITKAADLSLSLYIYIYIYICVCVCVCTGRERERGGKWVRDRRASERLCLVWMVHLLNVISIPYELFNAEIWFISKCLFVIIDIFSTFLHFLYIIIWVNTVFDIKYSYLIQIICILLYSFKYSYLMLIIYTHLYDLKSLFLFDNYHLSALSCIVSSIPI